MDWDIKIKYCKGIVKSELNDLVIVANVLNGNTVKLTSECLEIVEECINENCTISECLSGYEENSRIYLYKIFGLLLEKNIIYNKEDAVYYEDFALSQITLLVTNRCNLKCIHCCVDANCECDEAELSKEEWKGIIDKLEGLSLGEVIFSGGEPLIRKDIFELAEYAKDKLGVSLQLMTNGTLINEGNIDKIVGLFDSFSISLDGVDEESCSKVRGKGVFSKAIGGIELLKQRGVKNISLSYTVVKQNEDKVEEFKELVKKYDAYAMFRQFEIAGRAKEHLELLPERHKDYYTPKLSCPLPECGCFSPDNMPNCVACSAGARKMCIGSDGQLYACQVLVLPGMAIADLSKIDSLKNFIESGEIYKTKGYYNFLQIHPAYSEECRDCPVKLFCFNCIYGTYMQLNNEERKKLCERKREALSVVWK